MMIVKAKLPCGELLYFDEVEWGNGGDEEAWFVNPTPRCERCTFPTKQIQDDESICPAEIEYLDMPEEDFVTDNEN